MITEEYLKKFTDLYYKDFKVKLNREEATRAATDLLNLMRVLTKPLPKDDSIK
jgi:hypothetical protein